jgi:predicted MFS family arabinose efflux permease
MTAEAAAGPGDVQSDSVRPGYYRDGLLLGVSMFLTAASVNVLTPLLKQVQSEFEVDYATAGLLVSAFGLARLTFDLPAGFVEQRLGSGRMAGLGFLILLAGSVVAAVAPSFVLAVAARAAMGFGASILSVVILTTLSAIAPAHARTRVLTNYSLANNSAISIYPVVGGLMGELWGWRATMWLCAVLAVGSAALLFRILRKVGDTSAAGAREVASDEPAVRRSPMLLVTMGTLYFGCVIFMLNRHGFRNTVLPLFSADQLGLNGLQIATGISVMSLVGIMVAIPGGFLADRWSRRAMILIGFLILAVGDLAFLGATDYATFLLAAVVLGLGDFFSASQTSSLTELAPRRWRARVLGGYRFAVDLGAAIGPALLAGVMQATDYRTATVVAASLLLAAAAGSAVGVVTTSAIARARRPLPQA